MKRFSIVLACLLVVASSPVVRAEDSAGSLLLTDDQITLIKANCLEVQSTLQRIHASDALARFNLGQQYNIISTKLMAPMNSRVALNKMNGVALTQTTVDFNTAIDTFAARYQQYEETMQSALKINCRDQPISFFDNLNSARGYRISVREALDSINGLLGRYDTQVEQLRSGLLTGGGKS